MCFVPLTLLAPRPGFYVWTAINAASFLLALVLLFRWTPALSRDGALALAAVTILFPPVLDHLVFGQNKMLVLLIFVLMLRWMERGRDGAAGLMLAFATLLRAFPLLLVGYLILMKRWRVVAYTIAGLAVGGALTIALAGMGTTLSFVLAPTYLTEQWRQALPGNIAIGPTVARMFWYFFGMHLGTALQWAAKAASLAAELALLAFTIKVTVSRPRDDDPDGRLFILWIMTAILISPTSWFYYLVLLTIPMVKLSAAAANNRTSARALWVGVACYTLAWLYFTLVDMHSQTLASASGCAGLAAWSFAGGAARLSLALLVRVRFRFSRSGVNPAARFAIGRFGSAALLRCGADGAHRGLTIACRLSARYGSHCGPVDDMVTGIDHAR